MKAFLLAAGIGSRLGSITKDTPKALVKVAGRPILDYIIENLITAGVDSIVINLHYLPEQIKSHLADSDFNCKFIFSEEETLLDTGGALKNAAHHFEEDEDFILHNCDIYTDFDISKIVKAHKNSQNMATLSVSHATSDRGILLDHAFNFAGLENIKLGTRSTIGTTTRLTRYDYNCITVLNSSLFTYFEKLPASFGLFDWLTLASKSRKLVRGFDIKPCYWIDIGTPEDLDKLNQYLKS